MIALSLSELQRSRVILRPELADDLPPVTGDRVQLQQVILNLLRNASDAMSGVDDRPRQLVIRTERDEEGDRVRLTVQDAGVGFDPRVRSGSSKRSTRPRAAAWGSGCPSAAPSSRVIMAVSGRHRMMVREPRFHFPFPAYLGDATASQAGAIRRLRPAVPRMQRGFHDGHSFTRVGRR